MATTCGIANLAIDETPIAVVDFETTGLHPGGDRVVEVSIVRIEPGKPPELVLDTLINPHRAVRATEIHGITDADVEDAPPFDEVVGDVLQAIAGCVVAAYNVYFDIKFLDHELERAGVVHDKPHFCIMYLRQMLGIAKARCSLADACREHDIQLIEQHVAASDALAEADLLSACIDHARRNCGVRTFADLAARKSYKFTTSFAYDPYPLAYAAQLERAQRLKSRFHAAAPADPAADGLRHALGEYWEVLKSVVCDLKITDDELAYCLVKQSQLNLEPAQVRMLHARAFSLAITQFIEDKWIDQRECHKLHRLQQCLQALGWAPGDALPPGGL